MTDESPELYTTQEAAEELGVTDAYVRQMLLLRRGLGQNIGRKFGHQWMLSRNDLATLRARANAEKTTSETRP